MTKIMVSHEVAEALEKCASNYINTDLTLIFHAQKNLTGKYAPLQRLTITELATALVNGWEVEKTPEEKVREYYAFCKPASHTNYTNIGRRQGVIETLDLLGIKYEGVNA